MSDKTKTLTLHVWRQNGPNAAGEMKEYTLDGVSDHMSFLEMLDVMNEKLMNKGEEPIAFDHDCREGICGTCSLVIDGRPHGPMKGTTTCQVHMRHYHDGDTIVIEPFRAQAFPVLRDLVVDRSAFDRIQRAGGFVTANTGTAPDGNAIPVPKSKADLAFAAATCIGCGACVASCKNASASLFVSAKIAHLARLPQGEAERDERARNMVAQMDKEGFGACTNTGACSAACPVEISLENIALMNRDFLKASIKER